MGATATLSERAVQVAPGGEASVELRVKNTGSIVDEFGLQVLGDSAAWATIDPPTLNLFPQAEGAAKITFRPKRDPSLRAGQVPFGIHVVSKEDPNGSPIEEGTVTVAPYLQTTAELIPRTSSGSRGGSHEIAVDNRGNIPVAATPQGIDPDRLVGFEFDPPKIDVPPGAAGFVKAKVKPTKTFWRGQPKTRAFQVGVQIPENEPILLQGSYLQQAMLPSWLEKAVAALVALLLVAALLWIFVLRPTLVNDLQTALATPGPSGAPSRAPSPGGSGLGPSGGSGAPNGSGGPNGSAGGSGGPNGSGGASGGPSVSIGPTPTPTSTSVTPPPAASGQAPVTGRLDTTVDGVTASGGTLFVTDLIFSNPTGATGTIELQVGTADPMQRLLVLRLENFRDLDFHFVTPIAVPVGSTLKLVSSCTPPASGVTPECQPSVFYSGYIQPQPSSS